MAASAAKRRTLWKKLMKKNPINHKISTTINPQAAPPFYKLCHNVAGQLFYKIKGHFATPLNNH